MPEPSPAQNASGQTDPAPAWWSRLHSPTDPSHDDSATPETNPTTDVTPSTAPAPALWPDGWTVVPPVGSILTDVASRSSWLPLL